MEKPAKKAKQAASKYKAVDSRLCAPDMRSASSHIIVHLRNDDEGGDVAAFCKQHLQQEEVCAYNADDQGDFSSFAPEMDRDVLGPRHQILLGELEKRTDNGDWPCSINVKCHWCRHDFEGPPVVLPSRACSHVNYSDSSQPAYRWEVSGCFCSLECAAAYNFQMNSDSDVMWEIYALLNRMHTAGGGNSSRILPAPKWETLKEFGGYLTIEEFRRMSRPTSHTSRAGDVVNNNGRLLDVLPHPMAFVPERVEEVNEADIAKPLRYIPIDEAHISRVKKDLALRRTKKLVNAANTLDRVMNLQIEQQPDT